MATIYWFIVEEEGGIELFRKPYSSIPVKQKELALKLYNKWVKQSDRIIFKGNKKYSRYYGDTETVQWQHHDSLTRQRYHLIEFYDEHLSDTQRDCYIRWRIEKEEKEENG